MTTKTKKSLTRISRHMSLVLRHNPASLGLTLAEDGSVPIRELARALGVTEDTVHTIVAEDPKGRYATAGGRIWATQGHSIPVRVHLEEVAAPGLIYHGTKSRHVGAIRTEGLRPQGRMFVHLSADGGTALAVANRRRGTSVVLTIDGDAMVADGLPVYRSDNGVLLADGVPWCYMTGVTVH